MTINIVDKHLPGAGRDLTFLLDDERIITVDVAMGTGFWVRVWEDLQRQVPDIADPDFVLPWKMTLLYTTKHPDLEDQPYWDGNKNVSLNAFLKDGSSVPFVYPEDW